MMEIISTDLANQDLFVDAIYGGSRKGNFSDDPLPALLSIDNGTGFRCLGSPRTEVDTLKLLVLQTDFSNLDWPDERDIENGLALTSPHAPKPWLDWINKRKYNRLVAETTVGIRSTKEQTDLSTDEQSVISSSTIASGILQPGLSPLPLIWSASRCQILTILR